MSTESLARAEYDELAETYDGRWKSYLAATHDVTLTTLPEKKGRRLLDVGCGTGILLKQIADIGNYVELRGIDTSAVMLTKAQLRLRKSKAVWLHQASVYNLPFDDASFDVVVCQSAFHHYDFPEKALLEMKRVLTKNGTLILTDWNRDAWHFKIADRYWRRFNHSYAQIYTLKELQALLEQTGFEIEHAERFWSGLWSLHKMIGRKE